MSFIFYVFDIFEREVMGGVQKCHGIASPHQRMSGIPGLSFSLRLRYYIDQDLLPRECRCERPTGAAGCYANVTVRFLIIVQRKKIKDEQLKNRKLQFSPLNWDNVSTSCYLKMRRFQTDLVGFVPVKVKSREIP